MRKPVGVIPFETSAAQSTIIITCSKEAKAAGCTNIMGVPEARAICPDLVLVMHPQLESRPANCFKTLSKSLSAVRRFIFGTISTIAVAASLNPAFAGPPFLTDDPEPVDRGHWEVYGFTAATHVHGDKSGTLGGGEVNYGAAPNLQLHVIVPVTFDKPSGGPMAVGLGDTEFGVKYRFVTPGEDDWWPQIGVFPLVEVPTGNAQRGLGGEKMREYLPVWLQKDWSDWTTYGGGGYWINPGVGNQNYWFAGWLLQRQVTKSLALGAEIFHQTADTTDGQDTTGFNFGGIYDFNDHYHLLFSSGRGLQNPALTNQFSYYLAIQSTF